MVGHVAHGRYISNILVWETLRKHATWKTSESQRNNV